MGPATFVFRISVPLPMQVATTTVAFHHTQKAKVNYITRVTIATLGTMVTERSIGTTVN